MQAHPPWSERGDGSLKLRLGHKGWQGMEKWPGARLLRAPGHRGHRDSRERRIAPSRRKLLLASHSEFHPQLLQQSHLVPPPLQTSGARPSCSGPEAPVHLFCPAGAEQQSAWQGALKRRRDMIPSRATSSSWAQWASASLTKVAQSAAACLAMWRASQARAASSLLALDVGRRYRRAPDVNAPCVGACCEEASCADASGSGDSCAGASDASAPNVGAPSEGAPCVGASDANATDVGAPCVGASGAGASDACASGVDASCVGATSVGAPSVVALEADPSPSPRCSSAAPANQSRHPTRKAKMSCWSKTSCGCPTQQSHGEIGRAPSVMMLQLLLRRGLRQGTAVPWRFR
mmetsp:Transcript_24679/g.65644  ORF Transcript_24679/g.65644 Transcript_24679/m.65644 type:complete len:349 (-) Transcript_24679:48-1094(-)